MAFLAPVLASASTLQLIGAGLAVASAVQSIEQGNLRKKGYDARAKNVDFQGRVQALKAKKEGVKALKATQIAMANVNATYYAGGLEPNLSGSVNTFINNNILNPGFSDYFTAQDNVSLALSSAKAEADDLRFAGKQAKRQGYINALTTLSTTAINLGGIGGPPATATQPTYYGNTFSRAF